MKNLFLTSVLLLLLSGVHAQQKPYFTQYIMNNYIINPAITGIENYTDIKLSYRNQWNGIEGHPESFYFSAHGPLGKQDYRTTATSFQLPGENPRGKAYWEEYTAAEPHHGFGLIAMNDKTGYVNRFSAYATYAYHLGLNAKTSLSAGFLGGLSYVSLDRSKIEWATLDPSDPAIGYNNSELKKLKPEVGAGLWLYSADYFAGFSILNLIPGKTRFVTNETYGAHFEPQYLATAGVRTFLSDDVTLLPSVMVQFIKPFPIQIHGNVKLQFQDRFWVGAGYRHSDQLGGFAGMAGFFVSNSVNVSYAYDASTTNRLRYYSNNSHEVIVGLPLNNKYGDMCPKNIW